MKPAKPNFQTSGCVINGSRFGSGNWDQEGYRTTNHDGAFPNGIGPGATRYEMYLAEIAAANGGNILTGKTETGLPACNSSGPAGSDRRLLIAAGIDCESHDVRGNREHVPVQTFVQMFMTEPAGSSGSDSTVCVEEVAAVDAAGEAGNGVIRDVIQLYR